MSLVAYTYGSDDSDDSEESMDVDIQPEPQPELTVQIQDHVNDDQGQSETVISNSAAIATTTTTVDISEASIESTSASSGVRAHDDVAEGETESKMPAQNDKVETNNKTHTLDSGLPFNVLPTPTRHQHQPLIDDGEEALEDIVKPKTSQVADVVKPERRPKQPVRITIPHLVQDDDDKPQMKKQKMSSTRCGLFDLLPAPHHTSTKEAGRLLIPYTLTKRDAVKEQQKKPPAIDPSKTQTQLNKPISTKHTSKSGLVDCDISDSDSDSEINYFGQDISDLAKSQTVTETHTTATASKGDTSRHFALGVKDSGDCKFDQDYIPTGDVTVAMATKIPVPESEIGDNLTKPRVSDSNTKEQLLCTNVYSKPYSDSDSDNNDDSDNVTITNTDKTGMSDTTEKCETVGQFDMIETSMVSATTMDISTPTVTDIISATPTNTTTHSDVNIGDINTKVAVISKPQPPLPPSPTSNLIPNISDIPLPSAPCNQPPKPTTPAKRSTKSTTHPIQPIINQSAMADLPLQFAGQSSNAWKFASSMYSSYSAYSAVSKVYDTSRPEQETVGSDAVEPMEDVTTEENIPSVPTPTAGPWVNRDDHVRYLSQVHDGEHSKYMLHKTTDASVHGPMVEPTTMFGGDAEFVRLQGRRGRMKEEIHMIDVDCNDITGGTPDFTKSLSEETNEGRKKLKKDDGPTSQQRKKHQITYLAFQAKERELDLKNQWSQNRQTKKQTQAKYGF